MSRIVRPGAVSSAKGGEETRPGGSHPRRGDTDPNRPWLSYGQQQILDRLRTAVLARTGVLFLTGDVGTGKTFLAKALIHRLRAEAIIAAPMYALTDPQDFWREVSGEWGIQGSPDTLEAVYDGLAALLDGGAGGNKRVVLLVDEAQGLSRDLLAEIACLAVMAGEPRSPARLSILFVGQDELGGLLSRPENAELAKRVGARYVTEPFTAAEVHEYVAHHLAPDGREGAVFTRDGLQAVAIASQGIPRLINTIVDLALLNRGREATTIGAEVVRGCLPGLGHPTSRDARPGPTRAPRTNRMARPRRAGRAWLYVSALALLTALAVYVYRVGWPRDPTGEVNTNTRPAAALVPAPPVSGSTTPAERSLASEPGPAAAAVPGPPEGAAPRPVDTLPPARPGPPPAVAGRASEARPSTAVAPAPSEASVPRPVDSVPAARPAAPPAIATRTSEPGSSAAATPGPPVGSVPPAPVPPVPVRPLSRPLAEGSTARSENPAGATSAMRTPVVTPPTNGGVGRAPEVRAREESERDDPGSIIDWLLSEYPARRQ